MLRGMKTFVCDNCGHRFKGMDIELRATVLSQPMKCPNCGRQLPYLPQQARQEHLQEHLETDGRASRNYELITSNS